MKTRNITSIKQGLFFSLLLSIIMFISGCNDDPILGETYFHIEGEPTNLAVTTGGIVQKYVVRSNRDWQVVAQDSSATWVNPFPAEGTDDGIFKFTVNENTTPFDRTTHFAFIAGGVEQPVLFTVDQEASAPYFTLKDTLDVETNQWDIVGRLNKFRVNIEGNVNYSYTISDSWLTVAADSSFCLILEASENPDQINSRTATIDFVVADFPELNQSITIVQESFSPGINISNINELRELDFESEGGEITLNVDANVDWHYAIESNDWLTVVNESSNSVSLKATPNTTGVQRSLKLNFGFDNYNGGEAITIIQFAGVALVTENFNYTKNIVYGDNKASEAIYCYQTGPRFEFWENAEEGTVDYSNLSWTTPVLNVDGVPRVYAQNGYIKLGVTRKCTEIVFKKIPVIQGEVKLKVSFKAAAYVTANGNQNDNRLLQVTALNAGVASVDAFDINNFPEKGTHDDPTTYNVVWNNDRIWSFIISKATAETQIQFLAGANVGETAETNRISLDDIVISY